MVFWHRGFATSFIESNIRSEARLLLFTLACPLPREIEKDFSNEDNPPADRTRTLFRGYWTKAAIIRQTDLQGESLERAIAEAQQAGFLKANKRGDDGDYVFFLIDNNTDDDIVLRHLAKMKELDEV